MSHLLFDITDHIATLTFNQPEKRNAYSPEMAVNRPSICVSAIATRMFGWSLSPAPEIHSVSAST